MAGHKVSIVTTNARAPGGQFVLHARALPGNPYDGHTLRDVIEDKAPIFERIVSYLFKRRKKLPGVTSPIWR